MEYPIRIKTPCRYCKHMSGYGLYSDKDSLQSYCSISVSGWSGEHMSVSSARMVDSECDGFALNEVLEDDYRMVVVK